MNKQELSNEQYDTLFHLDTQLTAVETYLREKDKVPLADALLKFQQDAGNTYQSDIVPDYVVPEGTVRPTVEALTRLMDNIYQNVAADKGVQNSVKEISDSLKIVLPSQSKG